MSSLESEKPKDAVQQQGEASLAGLGGHLLSERAERNNARSGDNALDKLAQLPEAMKINGDLALKAQCAVESLCRHEPGKPSGKDLLTKDLVEDWKKTFAYLDPKVFDHMSA